jgi:DNA-binding beta-propeller fold protein YncE
VTTRSAAWQILWRTSVALLGTELPTEARAISSLHFDDVSRFIFVPSTEQPIITVVDGDSNEVVGALPIGISPQQVIISRPEAKLIATDGRSRSFVTLDLLNRKIERINLPHRTERLTLGTNGWLLAIADLAGGKITLFDLRGGAVQRTIDSLPPLRDMLFVDQDGYLFVAAEGWTGIAVFDVNTAVLAQWIRPFRSSTRGKIVALARTPNGRTVVIRFENDSPPSIIDVESRHAIAELGQTAATDGVVPSGTGAFLFVPDNEKSTLNVFRGDKPASATILPASTGMGAVYSAWLDSVAFVASTQRRQLLLFDLDKLRPAGTLDLVGIPGQGGVSADSTKVYVPLADPASLAVIDGQSRRVVATVPMPATPLAAVVPGGWGLCH